MILHVATTVNLMSTQSRRRTNVGKMAALSALIALSSRKHFVRAFTTSTPSLVLRTGTGSITGSISTTSSRTNRIISQSLVRLASTSSDVELTTERKAELESLIAAKGDEIRALKETGAEKQAVAPFVAELLALKAELDPSSVKPKKKKGGKGNNNNNNQKKKAPAVDENSDFITPRAEDYSKWYNDIIRVTGLAETSPVRGCMVIKPWGMSLWENVRNDLDVRIKEHGAENAYFPLLIPKSFLSKEAEHVDGFAKECAVVTHHRLTADPDGGGLIADPEAELEDPLIIRPTSETMIWHMFKKWIISHRYVTCTVLVGVTYVFIVGRNCIPSHSLTGIFL